MYQKMAVAVAVLLVACAKARRGVFALVPPSASDHDCSMQKLSAGQVAAFFAVFIAIIAYRTWSASPSVSGSLSVGGERREAERCTGFVGGVEIFLAGEGYHALTAAVLGDGSLRVTYDGEDVTCSDATLDAEEGELFVSRGSTGRPVIGGRLTVACQTRDGTPLEGAFEFDRCRQD